MNKIDTYKKVEKIGYDLFSKTGRIQDYGIAVSAKEMQKQLEREQEENQPGM